MEGEEKQDPERQPPPGRDWVTTELIHKDDQSHMDGDAKDG